MGITFLAAGTSVPEAVSSVIVAKQGMIIKRISIRLYCSLNKSIFFIFNLKIYFPGHGSMGISNSIGSNTFDILLCLGLPWLIKAALIPTEPGHHWVRILLFDFI